MIDQWEPFSKYAYSLRSLTRQNESLNKQKTILVNKLHSIENSGYSNNKVVVKQLKQFVKLIDKQLSEISKEIEATINKDIVIKEKVDRSSLFRIASTFFSFDGISSIRSYRLLKRGSRSIRKLFLKILK